GMRIVRAREPGTPLILMRCTGPDVIRETANGRSHDEGTEGGADGVVTRGARSAAPVEGQSQGTVRPAMEVISDVAGGVAHEFNNLLTVIQAEAEWALRRDPNAD